MYWGVGEVSSGMTVLLFTHSGDVRQAASVYWMRLLPASRSGRATRGAPTGPEVRGYSGPGLAAVVPPHDLHSAHLRVVRAVAACLSGPGRGQHVAHGGGVGRVELAVTAQASRYAEVSAETACGTGTYCKPDEDFTGVRFCEPAKGSKVRQSVCRAGQSRQRSSVAT